ncbi:hypothetical protein ABW20_dc0100634 [Dactylellina cionopaga]|nr:hypothetical protein ABW20_dc0100634 [Dactylellina cionopaga]
MPRWQDPPILMNGYSGEEFREAFSCFVFSKAEPKGVDCIEKFKGMQTCFQKFPEIYGEPPSDDEEEEEIDRKLADMDKEQFNSFPSNGDPQAPKEGKPTDSSPSSSLPHPAPQSKGTDEPSHPAPKDNTEPKSGTLGHPSPGEKGLGGGSHEGPVDTDVNPTGLTRPAPSTAGLEKIEGHGAPGVKGVSDPSGPKV